MEIKPIKQSLSNTKDLGTTDEYIAQLDAMQNTNKTTRKGDNSVFTEYDDDNGFKGSVFQEGKLTAVKIGKTSYFDYDGDHQIDKWIKDRGDGTEIDSNGMIRFKPKMQ